MHEFFWQSFDNVSIVPEVEKISSAASSRRAQRNKTESSVKMLGAGDVQFSG